MTGKSKYYGGIDIVRFVAALIVAVYHLGYNAWDNQASFAAQVIAPAIGPAITPMFQFGWVGVEIFFVISGFVIAGSAIGSTTIGFIKNRFLRLYPAAWICASLAVAIILLLHIKSLPKSLLLWSSTMVLNPLGPWIDPVYWTLGVEIVFYVLMAVWLLKRQYISLQTIAVLLTIWSGSYLLLDTLLGTNFPEKFARVLLLRHGVFFSLGVLLWLLSVGRLTFIGRLMLVPTLIAAGGEVVIKSLEGQYNPWTALSVWSASIVIIWISSMNATLKVNPFLRSLGLMTYPLYLIHQTVGGGAMKVLYSHGVAPLPGLLIGLLIAISISFIIAQSAEPLFRRFVRKHADSTEKKFMVDRPIWSFLYALPGEPASKEINR